MTYRYGADVGLCVQGWAGVLPHPKSGHGNRGMWRSRTGREREGRQLGTRRAVSAATAFWSRGVTAWRRKAEGSSGSAGGRGESDMCAVRSKPRS